MRGNSHVRCGAGENLEITSKSYLSLKMSTLRNIPQGWHTSYEMIAAAMEGKRLGLHNKALLCVPNHLTEQEGADFIKLYPNANILVATANDFTKENRRKLFAKIATGDYDCIIIGHSQLVNLPISPERQKQLLEGEIQEIIEGIEAIKAEKGDNFQIKQMEKTRKSLEAKLEKLVEAPKRDDVVYFEELGIDKLIIDEAHMFKNLFISTKMSNVSGISTNDDVQKTFDLYLKTQYLDEVTGNKGVIFATGTPIITGYLRSEMPILRCLSKRASQMNVMLFCVLWTIPTQQEDPMRKGRFIPICSFVNEPNSLIFSI